MNQLAVLLGGRSAEEIAIGEISTGAQNDLQRVSDLARAMVTEWGMSERLGTINFDISRRGRFLEIGAAPERGLYSEETAKRKGGHGGRRVARDHRQPAGSPADRLEARGLRLGERTRTNYRSRVPGPKSHEFHTIVSGRG
jgi:hypothetical protein